MSRFSRLSAQLAAHGAHNPDALAAYIGRKKYGHAGMAALAAAGRAKKKAKGVAKRSAPVSSLDPHYRSFTPDLQVRSQGDGRTICGIVVPWSAPTRIDDELVEQFARGAFVHQFGKPGRIKFEREHTQLGGSLIGSATMMRDDAAGQYMEFRVSRTPTGDETLELVKDGALDQLSIMFRERQNRRLVGGITERVKADMGAVAITMQGAYGELATVAGIRSAQIPQAAIDLDLRARAEEYLLDSALPEPSDNDLAIRAIRLGLPF